jgi:hypothetical protein
MATYQYELCEIPKDQRQRELWIQHAAGFIIFEDIRNEAINKIDKDIPMATRDTIIKSIDDAIYGMMSVIDGVTGSLRNENFEISLDLTAKIIDRESGEIIDQFELRHGDGMCMGVHGWMKGDFGKNTLAVIKSAQQGDRPEPVSGHNQ